MSPAGRSVSRPGLGGVATHLRPSERHLSTGAGLSGREAPAGPASRAHTDTDATNRTRPADTRARATCLQGWQALHIRRRAGAGGSDTERRVPTGRGYATTMAVNYERATSL